MLYVEGGTGLDMLRALAEHLEHPAAAIWDERVNAFHLQNNYRAQDAEAELDRVEGGFEGMPRTHVNCLRGLRHNLKGLAIPDNDGQNREDGTLPIRYWRRYETENYFVTPDVLRHYAYSQYLADDLFTAQERAIIDDALAEVILEKIFDGGADDYGSWVRSPPESGRLIWEAKTEHRKFSDVAEEFFRHLADRPDRPMLLKKSDPHRLVALATLTPAAEWGRRRGMIRRDRGRRRSSPPPGQSQGLAGAAGLGWPSAMALALSAISLAACSAWAATPSSLALASSMAGLA